MSGSEQLNCQTYVKPMRFLFSSSDFSIVQRIRERLKGFGIRYEIRGVNPEPAVKAPRYVELWVGRGEEFSQAVKVFSSALECAKVRRESVNQ
jgi:hypothetical protein